MPDKIKLCPLRDTEGAVPFVNTAKQQLQAACIGDQCAWYDDGTGECSVKAIAMAQDEILRRLGKER